MEGVGLFVWAVCCFFRVYWLICFVDCGLIWLLGFIVRVDGFLLILVILWLFCWHTCLLIDCDF